MSNILKKELNEDQVKLHVTHSLGGGIEYWVRSFSGSDKKCKNIVLKSSGIPGISGQRLALYNNIESGEPDYIWNLTDPIHATSITNRDYRRILNKIIADFHVNNILISSFIGHSLDILNTNLMTGVIFHDYYPLCPAVNIYFDKICKECKFIHLESCFHGNKLNSFTLASPLEWVLVRKSYLKLIRQDNIILIAPSASVEKNLIKIEPLFKETTIKIIPHGMELIDEPIKLNANTYENRKLKILILGRFSFHKGSELFKEIYKELLEVADIYILGCGNEGGIFRDIKGIHVVAEDYSQSELPKLIRNISPDMGLLLSIWPETFSYTLSELMMLKIPTLAMKVGSFEDRIVDGINGFLVEPEKIALVEKIRKLSEQRQLLINISNHLNKISHRTLKEMLDEYYNMITFAPVVKKSKGSKDRNYIFMKKAETLRLIYHLRKVYKEYDRLQTTVQRLNQNISAMEASKFWKLRNFYNRSKNFFVST